MRYVSGSSSGNDIPDKGRSVHRFRMCRHTVSRRDGVPRFPLCIEAVWVSWFVEELVRAWWLLKEGVLPFAFLERGKEVHHGPYLVLPVIQGVLLLYDSYAYDRGLSSY